MSHRSVEDWFFAGMATLFCLVLGGLFFLGCPKTITKKNDDTITQQTKADTSTESEASKTGEKSTDIHKEPTTIETKKADEEMGWVPPPPDRPDAGFQWKPVRRKTEDTKKTIGEITVKKDEKSNEESKAKGDAKTASDTKAKLNDLTVEKHPGILEILLGSHWRLILFGVVGIAITLVIAYINPALLSIPAKVIKFALGAAGKIIAGFKKKGP